MKNGEDNHYAMAMKQCAREEIDHSARTTTMKWHKEDRWWQATV
jgi:hypothetical protein